MSEANKTAVTRRLPTTVAGLRAFNPNAKPRVRNLIDEVQQLHDELWEGDGGDEYRALFEAISNAGAQEGAIDIDESQASDMIRERARNDNRNEWVGRKKLGDIRTALRHVRRRYGISLKQLKGLPDTDENSDG